MINVEPWLAHASETIFKNESGITHYIGEQHFNLFEELGGKVIKPYETVNVTYPFNATDEWKKKGTEVRIWFVVLHTVASNEMQSAEYPLDIILK